MGTSGAYHLWQWGSLHGWQDHLALPVLEKLGEGGMGVVYKAKDTHLDRFVALKLLPAERVADPERKRRFIQEAKAASALNHPNIIVIYAIESENGCDFIVMEYVAGRTLHELIGRKPMRASEALRSAVQIADALAKAHSAGIVHRDLKPSNVMITDDGLVKVLDFGLAKLMEVSPSGDAEETLPGRPDSPPHTEEGAIVGTVGYMSPEQAEGKAVDARSDIFSFGSLLYEMATGQPAFQGTTRMSTLAAIIGQDPKPPSQVAERVPAELERIVTRCLRKEVSRRAQHMADVKLALDDLKADYDSDKFIAWAGAPAVSVAPRKARWPLYAAGVAVAAALAGFALARWVIPKAAPAAPVVRFQVLPPPELTDVPTFVALSPDGMALASVGRNKEGKLVLWTRRLDETVSRTIPGSDNGYAPFWSPDGRVLGFFAGTKLMTVDLATGSVQALCDVVNGSAGFWAGDGYIYFSLSSGAGIRRLPANGGVPEEITQKGTDSYHLYPQVLPDKRNLLYTETSGGGVRRDVYLHQIGSKQGRQISGVAGKVSYISPGFLAFGRGDDLYVQRIDVKKAELRGEPLLLARQVMTNIAGWTRAMYYSFSSTGALAYRVGSLAELRLVKYDRNGKVLETIGESGDYSNPALSPDGTRLAVGIRDSASKKRDIWIFDLKRGSQSRLTFDPADDLNPVWSPDGSRIAFSSDRKGVRDIYVKAAHGEAEEQLLHASQVSKSLEDWSPDGSTLLANVTTSPGGIGALTLSPSPEWKIVLEGRPRRNDGAFSPDGKYIAYTSNESGKAQVSVQTYPPGKGKWDVSVNGGSQPKWSRDGKELFYISGSNLIRVKVAASRDRLDFGPPEQLFSVKLGPALRNHYVVAPDGKSFIFVARQEAYSEAGVTIVLNWPSLLPK